MTGNTKKIIECVKVCLNPQGKPMVVVTSTRMANESDINKSSSKPMMNTDTLLREIFPLK